jgi:enamine deaminase RidA (YjgF/YER057c/UK114 family)
MPPQPDPARPGRFLHTTGTKYEFQFGYSRAVRHGNVIRVAGTAGLDQKGVPLTGGIVEQTRRALEIIEGSLQELGATFNDVIMTRIYVSEVQNIDSVAVIHGEVFREIRPATTIVKVDFIDPRILVEIEAEAVYGGADAKR